MNMLLATVEISKILIPAAVLLAVAILFAVLLSYLGKILTVEKDSKIDEVRECLSGANCGGCGKAGCDDFAEALVKGEAKLSDCKQVTKENQRKINEILSLEEGGTIDTVAVVRCNGGNACKDKYTYLGYGDCKSSELLAGGSKACAWGCLGMTSCTKVCNYDAINVTGKGVSVVDVTKCVSCGLCIRECPKGIIERVPKTAGVYVACSNKCKGKDVIAVCSNGCIACGLCEKNCEAGAIKVIDNIAVVDYYKCTSCFKCVDKCPKKVIHKLYE